MPYVDHAQEPVLHEPEDEVSGSVDAMYYYAENWTPRKKEVSVEPPANLDLELMRGRGLQPGEIEQPEDETNAAIQGEANSGAVVPNLFAFLRMP
ncbi:hypothetical protein BSKO_02450 [Bryopsis sp. KO-2023]|nr:hypothetical protein BSKO_02450 [Bryopsis sp. KO-2023]